MTDKFFWLSLLAAGFLLSPTLWFGFGMDQSIYSYGAWVWKTYHLPPYIGVWDSNFPGIFLISRVALELFGDSMLGFRIFDFLVQLNCLALIFYLSKKLSGSGAAAFLACLFNGMFYLGLGRWDAGQRDAFVFWFLLLAVFCGVSLGNRVWLRAILVGLFAGWAFLVRPTYGLVWPVFGIFLLVDGFRQRPVKIWAELLVFSLCCCLPSLAVILYYWKGGYLSELYEAVIFFNFSIYSKLKSPSGAASALGGISYNYHWLFAGQPLIAVLALLAALSGLKNKNQDPAQKQTFLIILAMVSVAVINFLMMGKNHQYHLIPFWGFMIVISGTGVSGLVSLIQKNSGGVKSMSLTGILYLGLMVLAFASVPPKWTIFAFQHSYRGLDSAYLSSVDYKDQLLTENHYLAAKYLQELLRPGDQVGLFGGHPLLSFLLKNKTPSRFVMVQHLLHSPNRQPLSPVQKKWIQEYTRDMISARPRFFVIAGMEFPFPTGVPASTFREGLQVGFPELGSFLGKNYRPLKTIGHTEIYELKPDQAPVSPGGEIK